MTTFYEDNEGNAIEVDRDSAVGPRVLVTGEIDDGEIEAQLPDGWTVGDNWHLGVRLADGRMSYPLVRAEEEGAR